MKHFFALSAATLMCLSFISPAWSLTVACVNCSDNWTQQMERVTSLEQLRQLMSNYHEAIQQTQQQIELVRNNIQQYQNMVKNTLKLPANLLNQVKGEFARLAQLSNQLKTLKGDVMAMGEVFNDIYPDLELLKNLAGGKGGVGVKEIWEKWSKETDRASQAAFQVTGSQLKDLAENSEAPDQHSGQPSTGLRALSVQHDTDFESVFVMPASEQYLFTSSSVLCLSSAWVKNAASECLFLIL